MNPLFIQIALAPHMNNMPDNTKKELANFLRKNNLKIRKICKNIVIAENSNLKVTIEYNDNSFKVKNIKLKHASPQPSSPTPLRRARKQKTPSGGVKNE
jgi:hypothetical protein